MQNSIGSDFVIYDRNGNEKKNIYGKKMHNSQNAPENNKASELKFEDALAIVSYPKYILDYIKQFLLENYSNNDDLIKIYMISNSERENIFVIEYGLIIELNNKNYKIYVLVYLPILFPNYPPEFYIEKTTNLSLNKIYMDGKINPNDLKINIDYFGKFDANTNNIPEIIDNLVINFTQYFPVFKDNSSNNSIINSGKCFLDKTKANLIKLPENSKSYSNNQNSNRPNLNKKNQSFENFKKNPSVFEVKGPFNDKTFLAFIRKQTKDIIGYNYVEFKEKYNIKENLDNLRTIYNTIKQRSNNTNNLYKKNEQLKSQIQTLKNIKTQLQKYEKRIEQDLKTVQNSNKTFAEKCDEIINIPNQKDMEFLIKIKVMEDYLVYLKKGFEKGIVKFDVMMNLTRSLSREIFNMNYMRSKYKR